MEFVLSLGRSVADKLAILIPVLVWCSAALPAVTLSGALGALLRTGGWRVECGERLFWSWRQEAPGRDILLLMDAVSGFKVICAVHCYLVLRPYCLNRQHNGKRGSTMLFSELEKPEHSGVIFSSPEIDVKLSGWDGDSVPSWTLASDF